MVGDKATVRYTVPMPSDGVTSESASVLDFVKSGPPKRIRTSLHLQCPKEFRQGTDPRLPVGSGTSSR